MPVLNLSHLPLQMSLVLSVDRLSCASRPQGKFPASRSEIMAGLETGYPEKKRKWYLSAMCLLCQQKENPKSLHKSKIHRRGFRIGENQDSDQEETAFVTPSTKE